MKVIVIDDDPVALEVTRAALESLGHAVVTLKSPIGATGVLLRERPDLALVDVQMPGLSGVDWLKLIRDKNLLGEDLHVDFVLYSGLLAEDLERLVKQTGALARSARKAIPPASSRPSGASPRESPSRNRGARRLRAARGAGWGAAASTARCPHRCGRVSMRALALATIRSRRRKAGGNRAVALANLLE